MDKLHVGGSIVTFVNRGVRVNALVVQSELTNILDKTVPEGIRQEEHLTLVYLKPELLQNRMGGADVDRAIGKEFGVLAFKDAPDDPNNLLRYALVGGTDGHTRYSFDDPSVILPVALNPHPELVQYSPVHHVQIPAIRTRHNPGKIPVETSYRETEPSHNPDGGPYLPAVDVSTDPSVVTADQQAQEAQASQQAQYLQDNPPAEPVIENHHPETPTEEWLRKEKDAKEHPDPVR